MSQDDSERARRAEARRRHGSGWPIRVFALGQEPLVDELDARTPGERVRDCERLSRQAFALSGQPWPSYTRATMPGRIIRQG